MAAVFSVTAQNACGAGPSTNSPSATPSGSGTTYASAVIADAPSEYYRLGDTSGTVMADSSAYALDGQYGSQTELGQPGALPSNPNASSIYYPGYYGGIGSSPALIPQFNDSRTVTAWINSTATDDPLVVGWGSQGTDQSFIVGFDQSAITVDGDYDFHVTPTNHPIADGNWHFTAVTYNGSTASAYLDGQLQGTATFNSPLATFGSSLAIGSSPLYYNSFVGNMQDVAVYPMALTTGQVAQYGASGYSAPIAPPVAHASPAGPNRHKLLGVTPPVSWSRILAIRSQTSVARILACRFRFRGIRPPRWCLVLRQGRKFTVTATDATGTGPSSTTNSYVVPGSSSTYASQVLGLHPSAFYRLGDGITSALSDSSGNEATGIYNSDVTLGTPGPIVGDGTTAVSVGPSGAVGTAGGALPLYDTPRTAEAWFNTSSPSYGEFQTLMSWGSNGTDQAFMVGEASSEIWVDGSNDFHGFPTPYPISDGNWHFVAVT